MVSELLQTLLSIICSLSVRPSCSAQINYPLQHARKFNSSDILADIFRSLSALAICSWYHKQMLERKRQGKDYHGVAVAEGHQLADLEAAIADREFELSGDEGKEEEDPGAETPSLHPEESRTRQKSSISTARLSFHSFPASVKTQLLFELLQVPAIYSHNTISHELPPFTSKKTAVTSVRILRVQNGLTVQKQRLRGSK